MAYSIAHHASNSGNSTAPNVTITAPTSGNLLVAFVFTTGVENASASGWTEQINDQVGNEKQYIYWKVSSGAEVIITDALGLSQPWSCFYMEIAGFTAGTTPTLDQWSWTDTGSTSFTGASNSANGNGTATASGTFTTNANEAAVTAFGWDPPELGKYAWIDGIRVPLISGGHSGGKSAGSFTAISGWTQVDTSTSQVNAAAYTNWASFGSGINIGSAQGTYSVAGPNSGNVMSFYGESSVIVIPSPVTILQAINRSNNF